MPTVTIAICGILLVFGAIVGTLWRTGSRGGRIGASALLAGAALICGYMFWAGFEYPGVTTHKTITGSLTLLFLGLAFFAARPRTPR